jgi:hypothetical protein
MTDNTTLDRARAYLSRKYIARADARQASMGLSYIEAEKEDLAREMTKFAAGEVMRFIERLSDDD